MPTPLFNLRLNDEDRQKLQAVSDVYQVDQSTVIRHLVRATYGLLAERQGQGDEKEAVQA
jgi:hypothetical protein